jgi:spermidine/putrescine transport system substrate-binding protein
VPSILPSSNRRAFIKGATATLSTLALSSCGWTLGKVNPLEIDPKNSKKDILYLYTWAGYTDDDLLKSFTDQTGIKVIADVFSSNEEMLNKIQAGGGGGYSIIYPSDYMIEKMATLGLIQELDHSKITGLDYLFSRFQDPVADPKNGYSIPMSWGTTGLVYNSEKIKTPPNNLDYLWENQKNLGKKVTLLEDVREVMGAVLKMLGYSYNSTDPEQIKQAYNKLNEIKPAIASFISYGWENQIQSGDILISMCFSADGNKIREESKDKFKYIIPSEGSSLWMDTMVIPKTAPNVEGAYAWINYNLQPDISAKISERLSFATPNKLAFELLPKSLQNNQGLFPNEQLLAKCETIKQLGKFAEVYEDYWTKLRSS